MRLRRSHTGNNGEPRFYWEGSNPTLFTVWSRNLQAVFILPWTRLRVILGGACKCVLHIGGCGYRAPGDPGQDRADR